MTDMWRGVHGRPADVNPDVALFGRYERCEGASGRVM
jgi:hypothetical protein